MDLTGIMRISFVLGWVFAALAIVYRGLQMFGIQALNRIGVNSGGVLFFSCFLFLVTVALPLTRRRRTRRPRRDAAPLPEFGLQSC